MPAPTPERGILFVHQAAARNGSSVTLLNFLRWLKSNTKRPFSVLLDHQGELAGDFANVTETWCASDGRWSPDGVRSQVMSAIGLGSAARRIEKGGLRRFATHCHPALIYSNGFDACNSRLIELLDLKLPTVTHVHELGLLFCQQGRSATIQILSGTHRFIACSSAVKENLMHEHGVAPERVEVVHESIPVRDVQVSRSRADVLREFGFPDDVKLIVGCGSVGWNKGTDLFVQLARLVCEQRARARFAWVGGGSWEIGPLERDLRKVALLDKVRLTGVVEKPADYLSAADIFVLPSREDSFPLVCLEAAALGKPIVCFADAGGAPEFVEDDCGFVVPYLDVDAMAARLISLLDCPGRPERMGAAAGRKVARRHDVSLAAPRIVEIIERTIAESPKRASNANVR